MCAAKTLTQELADELDVAYQCILADAKDKLPKLLHEWDPSIEPYEASNDQSDEDDDPPDVDVDKEVEKAFQKTRDRLPSSRLVRENTSTPEDLATSYRAAFEIYDKSVDLCAKAAEKYLDEMPRFDISDEQQYEKEMDSRDNLLKEKELYRGSYERSKRLPLLRDADQANAQGFVGHADFKADSMNSSEGPLKDALHSSVSDGKHHYGQITTVDNGLIWRFDIFPANGDQKDGLSIDDAIGNWKKNNSFEGRLTFLYLKSGVDVKNYACWVRLARSGYAIGLMPSDSDQYRDGKLRAASYETIADARKG